MNKNMQWKQLTRFVELCNRQQVSTIMTYYSTAVRYHKYSIAQQMQQMIR